MIDPTSADTLKDPEDRKDAGPALAAIKKAQQHYRDYQALCDRIDDFYVREDTATMAWSDHDYDLFWASTEIALPSIHAKVPKPNVSPMFNDRRPLYVTTSEMLERALSSSFENSDMDESLLAVRNDLYFYGRGVLWATYVSDDGQEICYDHVNRHDFVHPPARKWSEVPWVARGVWMTQEQAKDRFKVELPKGCYRDQSGKVDELEGLVRVWEVWHKEDDRIYWVAEHHDEILEDKAPLYKLKGFFPCPRPAYGTLKAATLDPKPDFIRYEGLFNQINTLTKRIYTLLDSLKMKGLVAGGGDVADAAMAALRAADDKIIIPVPGAALATGSRFVEWLPIDMVVQTVTAAIEARREFMSDFDRLSGISDIMRGETEANETLGAQQLKGQYGSIRVAMRREEMVRVSRDVTRIAAEIQAEHFKADTLLDMSQLEIRKRAEIDKDAKEVEENAITALQEAQASGDPQAFEQAKAQIMGQAGAELKRLAAEVSIEDVMKLLRDKRARCFAFEIETNSTILTDEMAAKQSANELFGAFTSGMSGFGQFAAMGEEAVRVYAEVLKYTLSPYRPPRAVITAIDDFLDSAGDIAARMQAEQGEKPDDMAALAEAEMRKAEVAGEKVQMDAQKAQMQLQQQQMKMQADFQEKAEKLRLEQEKLGLQAAKQEQEFAAKMADLDAKQNLMQAQTAEILARIGLDVRKQDVEEYKVAADVEMRANEQAISAQQREVDTALRVQDGERAAQMGERQQSLAEQRAQRTPE